jgi:Sec-independent protein translocase protein TatA
MEILGVGPLELLFIVIIALIILGPKDMIKAGRTIGIWLRKLVQSPTWTAIQRTSRDISNLPNKLIRDAGLDELDKQMPDLRQISQEINLNDVTKQIQKNQNELAGLSIPLILDPSASFELANPAGKEEEKSSQPPEETTGNS